MHLRDQLRAKELLEKLYRTGRIPSSLLLHGPEGVGKTVAALDFSRGLLCREGKVWGCGGCASCRRFDRIRDAILSGSWEDISLREEQNGRSVFLYLMGDHPDFIFVPPSGQSLKVDQIRALRAFVEAKPALSPRKVAVIDSAHLMTRESANALLKTLEEPPLNTHLILTALSEGSLLPTILSRVHPVALKPLEEKTLLELLPDAEEEVRKLSRGSYTRARLLEEHRDLVRSAEEFTEGDPLRIYEIALQIDRMEPGEKILFTEILEDKLMALFEAGKLGYDKLEMLSEKLSELREGIPRGIRTSLALLALSILMEEKE